MLQFVEIFGRSFPTYGICMAVGIVVASLIGCIRAKRAGHDENSLIIIIACGFAFCLVGAKLLYIVVSHGLVKAIQEMLSGDFSSLMGSGLVFYGGLIGGIGGAFVGSLIAGEKVSVYCDSAVPCIPIGHAFGRLGCFLGGCCYGIPYDGWGGVTFPQAGVMEPVLPVQLFEVVLNLVIAAILFVYTMKSRPKYHTLYLYLIMYGVVRFSLEFLRGDGIRGAALAFSTSQWISLGLIAVSAVLMFVPPMIRKEQTA